MEHPRWLRVGRSESFRLSLAVEGDRLVATAEVEGSEVTGEPIQIQDVYETHDVQAIASLHAAGLRVLPEEPISEPLMPGRSVSYHWNVAAEEAGSHVVTFTLRLRFQPKGGGNAIEETVWSRPFPIEARALSGLIPAPVATWIGAIGSAFGTFLGFPFLKEVIEWFLRRRRETAS